MATTKLGTTKVANRLINYADKKDVLKKGIDCDPKYAKEQFRVTRELYGKNESIQAHHIIQSFKPGEVSADQANKIGVDLAKKIGKGHESLVYTHVDQKHIHNHIIINSVSHDNGKKLHLHGKAAIEYVRKESDRLCLEKGLSIVTEPSSKIRFTLAEKSIIEKGQVSWKDEIRQAIDHEKTNSESYKDFKENLAAKYGIEVNDRGKHITYKHSDHEKVVRGNKLGLDYERGTIENGFNRQIERGQSFGEPRKYDSNEKLADGKQGTKQAHAELYSSPDERGHYEEGNRRKRTGEYEKDEHGDPKENGINIADAREHAENLRRQSSKGYGDWKKRNDKEQSDDSKQDGGNRQNSRGKLQRNGEDHEEQLPKPKTRNHDISHER